MAEQPRLDVFALERFFQERIVEQVDLTDRQIIGRAPISIHLSQLFGIEWTWRCGCSINTRLPFGT
jgi:hypothetical protein